MKNTFAMILVAALIAVAPAAVSYAADGAPSYLNKKQGRVAFQDKKDDAAESAAQAQPAAGEENPAAIEPAAGAEAMDAPTQERNDLADSMRLPRKN